jgi:hypothetical protein
MLDERRVSLADAPLACQFTAAWFPLVRHFGDTAMRNE